MLIGRRGHGWGLLPRFARPCTVHAVPSWPPKERMRGRGEPSGDEEAGREAAGSDRVGEGREGGGMEK